jgi:Uma2 family endonuclease
MAVPSEVKTIATAAEAEDLRIVGRWEVLAGAVNVMPPAGGDHGTVSLRVARLIDEYVERAGGRGFGAETGFVLEEHPLTMRAPDAAYVSEDHAAAIGASPGFWPGAPDLAVEVVSPTDTYREVHEKALHWLEHATAVVLVVDGPAGLVTRYRSASDIAVIAGEEPVDCSPAMPGFAPPAARLLGRR